MGLCNPATQFCCGCRLSHGVVAILAFTLMYNLFYISTATSNIILRNPTYGAQTSLTTQTFNAAFALIGLPFIAAGFYGTMRKHEQYVRIFLVYYVLAFVVDLGFIIASFIVHDPCESMPSALKRHGSAFACGTMRMTVIVFITMVTVFQAYAIFTIWSFCEELKVGTGKLLDLQFAQDPEDAATGPYDGMFGTGAGSVSQRIPVGYGSVSGAGIGGSVRLFGGSQHCVEYPPTH
jgi:hypothetical protein